MKKSKFVTLMLITAALASCHKKEEHKGRVYMRSDESAGYSHSPILWYYAFRPYGIYDHGVYHRQGFYSSGISESSNLGKSYTKSQTVRGGFGGRGISVSS